MGDNSANQIQPSPDHLREISRMGRQIGNRFVERKAVVVRIYVGADPVLRTEEEDTRLQDGSLAKSVSLIRDRPGQIWNPIKALIDVLNL